MAASGKYILFTDGGSRGNPGPGGIGFVVVGDQGAIAASGSRRIGHATNNAAEYLAVVYALQEAVYIGAKSIVIKTDSQLIARQLKGTYKVKDPSLRIYNNLALNLFRCFDKVDIVEIPREENTAADKLVNKALDGVDDDLFC